jgi:hypothetical protein
MAREGARVEVGARSGRVEVLGPDGLHEAVHPGEGAGVEGTGIGRLLGHAPTLALNPVIL